MLYVFYNYYIGLRYNKKFRTNSESLFPIALTPSRTDHLLLLLLNSIFVMNLLLK
jgi:hypothetical protein